MPPNCIRACWPRCPRVVSANLMKWPPSLRSWHRTTPDSCMAPSSPSTAAGWRDKSWPGGDIKSIFDRFFMVSPARPERVPPLHGIAQSWYLHVFKGHSEQLSGRMPVLVRSASVSNNTNIFRLSVDCALVLPGRYITGLKEWQTVEIVYTPVWQNPGNARSPLKFVQDEISLMDQVEKLGFDACFSPEHHFDIDYSACPDNFLPLSWLAGRTTKLKVGLGAVILPWNDPLRAVEKLSLLDHLSNGRCLAGFGRGLAKMEYAHFGIPMEESRGRFDEAVGMVLAALRTGHIEGDGPFYKQVPTPIHPTPRPSLAEG